MENFHDGSLINDSELFGSGVFVDEQKRRYFVDFKHIDVLLCCESSLETYQHNNNSVVYNRINLSLCCLPDAVFFSRKTKFLHPTQL